MLNKIFAEFSSSLSILIVAIVTILPIVLTTRHAKSNSFQLKPSLSASFYIIPLGTSGGLEENNLSSYIVTSVNDDQTPNSTYVALDGGTIHYGVR